MRILFTCDQKWRDLPALVAIKYFLEQRGHRAIIVPSKEFEALVPLFQPNAVVLNHFWDRRYCDLSVRLRAAGIAVIVLPTEGSAPTSGFWASMIFGAYSDYSLIDYQLCWNAAWADGIAAYGSMPREKLDIVGCPRFDFSVPPLVETAMTRERFCAAMSLNPARSVVTWASRFAQAKMAYAKPEQRAAFDAISTEIGTKQSYQRVGHSLDDVIMVHKTLLDRFIDAFGYAARELPDCQFVFKPHPNDDIDYIQKRLNDVAPQSVKIAVGVYISDVLRGSDILVNNSCNTSIEAWVHGIPVIDAQLYDDPVTGRPDIAAGNWVATRPEDILQLIGRGLADRNVSPEIKAARQEFITTWFHRIDGKRCEAAAASLDRFLRTRSPRKRFYSLKNGGGAMHVARQALAWLMDVPGGTAIREALHRRERNRIRGGVFDKVITRSDVRAAQARIVPMLAGECREG